MNVKKEVIDQMRAISRSKDLRATSCMIENWANALEQDEQQTPPMATGEPCAGESGVQPAANVLAKLRDRLVDMQTDANYMVLEAVDEKRWDDATAQRHAAEAFDSIIDIIDELSEANQ